MAGLRDSFHYRTKFHTAHKFMQDLTRPQFARYYLMRLGIGNGLKHVALNPKFPYRPASVEEVLALWPELQPPG